MPRLVSVFIFLQVVCHILAATGQKCRENEWETPTGKCQLCNCSFKGSVQQKCNLNGQCICAQGFNGLRCDAFCGECFSTWDKMLKIHKSEVSIQIKNAQGVEGTSINTLEVINTMELYLEEISQGLQNKSTNNLGMIDANLKALKTHFNNTNTSYNKFKQLVLNAKVLNKNSIRILNEHQNITDILQIRMDELGRNSTKLKESNLQDVVKLTEDAKNQANNYVFGAATIMDSFKNMKLNFSEKEYKAITENNLKELQNLHSNLKQLKDSLFQFNEFICGGTSFPCDDKCGGAGCTSCAGSKGCSDAAKQKIDEATLFANEADKILQLKESIFMNMRYNMSDNDNTLLQQFSDRIHELALQIARNINDTKLVGDHITKEILNFGKPTSVDIQALQNDVLNKEIHYKPDFVKELANNISNTAESFNDASWILEATKNNMTFAKKLKEDADSTLSLVHAFKRNATHAVKDINETELEQRSLESDINSSEQVIKDIAKTIEELGKYAEKFIDETDNNQDSLKLLDTVFEEFLKNVDENKKIAGNLESEAAAIIESIEANTKFIDKFTVAAEELKDLLRSKEKFYDKADNLLSRSQKLVGMISEISEFDVEETNVTGLERNVTLLLHRIKKYEDDINASIEKMKC